MAPANTTVTTTQATTTTKATTATTTSLLNELVALTRAERNDLAVRLLEINALRVEGEITEEDFTTRRANLYSAYERRA
jgi:hypothetical protein